MVKSLFFLILDIPVLLTPLDGNDSKNESSLTGVSIHRIIHDTTNEINSSQLSTN